LLEALNSRDDEGPEPIRATEALSPADSGGELALTNGGGFELLKVVVGVVSNLAATEVNKCSASICLTSLLNEPISGRQD
jgi:hypothetical protein